jgi:membrane protease YdiL (CAAX protease family)
VNAVDSSPAAVPIQPATPVLTVPRTWRLPSWFATLQCVAVSGIPTQLVLMLVLWLGFGLQPFESDISTKISFEFVATLLLADTALVAILIRVFLILSGEDSRAVFLGRRRVGREIVGGLLILPLVFAAVTGIVLFFRVVLPWMHTVQDNPLAEFMKTPFDAAIFLVVVVLAGGIREELQRGFILHRSAQIHFEIPIFGRKLHIGGVRQGLVMFSLTFGLLHLDQGLDVSVALALLGFFWGLLYLRRGSIVMSMTNHACFNAAQVAQVLIARSLGA